MRKRQAESGHEGRKQGQRWFTLSSNHRGDGLQPKFHSSHVVRDDRCVECGVQGGQLTKPCKLEGW